MEIVIARKAYFSCGIIFRSEDLTAAQSQDIYGDLARSEYGTGFNFTLECFFQGPTDPISGLVVNLTDVDQILKSVLKPLDHQNISKQLPAFKDNVATLERLTEYLFAEIQRQLTCITQNARLIEIQLSQQNGISVSKSQ